MDRRSLLRGLLGLGGVAVVACMKPPPAEAAPIGKLAPPAPDLEPTAAAPPGGVATPEEEQNQWIIYRRRRWRPRYYVRRRYWRRRYWPRRRYWRRRRYYW